jgi:hypothetical protein
LGAGQELIDDVFYVTPTVLMIWGIGRRWSNLPEVANN